MFQSIPLIVKDIILVVLLLVFLSVFFISVMDIFWQIKAWRKNTLMQGIANNILTLKRPVIPKDKANIKFFPKKLENTNTIGTTAQIKKFPQQLTETHELDSNYLEDTLDDLLSTRRKKLPVRHAIRNTTVSRKAVGLSSNFDDNTNLMELFDDLN